MNQRGGESYTFFGEREFLVWILIIIAIAILGLAALCYLVTRFHRFSFIAATGEKLSWFLALLPLLLLGLFAGINVTTLIVVTLHLTAAFLLCGLVRRAIPLSYDAAGAAAIALTVIYLAVGWFLAHHVFETDYRFETEKALRRDYRIAAIADAHIGVTLNGERFAREMARIQALEPDAVVIVGDFVDDDTRAEDMIGACRALGELKTAFGVFFVYGNHDRGYSHDRDFSADDLRAELEKNGVVILEDESVLLDGSFYLTGRRDRSNRERTAISDLMAELDGTKYTVVLDHQPNDYEAEAAAHADLVISGHTHGGHIFPAGWIGTLMRANDLTYGTERRGDTDFVVSSGISGWAIPFKTGTVSEVVVIEIAAKT